MNEYIKGKFKHLFNPAVSVLALIDDKSIVDKRAKINRFSRVIRSSVGRYSYVGINSWIINTHVGQFCSIATDVYIGLAEHTLDYISTSPLFTEVHNATGHSFCKIDIVNPEAKKTHIGNDVWIGYRALIKSGIRIGNGAVIGAGAVVTKDIPPYAIVAGIPARILRFRFSKDTIEKLEIFSWWNKEDSFIVKNIKLFQSPLNMYIPDIHNNMESGGG